MTAKEKAEELIYKFSEHITTIYELEGLVEHVDSSKAKGHALTAIDEVLFVLEFNLDFKMEKSIKYWQIVKKEIQNL